MRIPDLLVFMLFISMALISLYNLVRAIRVRAYVEDGEGRRLLTSSIVFSMVFGMERTMLAVISGTYSTPPIPWLRTLIVEYGLWLPVELVLLGAMVYTAKGFWQSISPRVADDIDED